VVLTLIASAVIIVGAFLSWVNSMAGTTLTIKAYYTTDFGHATSFLASAGFVALVIGLVAIIGLAGSSGWLTRLAGALGIVGFVLIVIQVVRANAGVAAMGAGLWMLLAGGIVALVAGFLGRGSSELAAPAGTRTVVYN
jgi:hypothetical protein